MQECPYSLMIDGSNDTSIISQMYPITVRIFYEKFNRVTPEIIWHELDWGDWHVNSGSYISKCWYTIDKSRYFDHNSIKLGKRMKA